MPLDSRLLDLLACPEDRGALRESNDWLVCARCGRRYPVHDGIPVLLVDQAERPGRPEAAPPPDDVGS